MQNIEDLRDKLFFESRNIIETLSKIASSEELLSKKDLVEELNERISFLKLLERNEEYFVAETPLQQNDNQDLNSENYNENNASENQKEDIEEEVLFTNELNEFNKDEISEEEKPVEVALEVSHSEEIPDEEEIHVPEERAVEENPVITNEEVQEYSEKVADAEEKTEQEIENAYESKRQIVEFEKPEPEKKEIPTPEHLARIQEKHEEKGRKFKLAHIKGLKAVESLFDEDPLENIPDEAVHESPENEAKETSSLLKANVPTDFMEAPKPKPEFRLDLNDKIAFSKTLFGGSQTDLNDAIRNLNSFKTLEEAKEYLSDLYYEKNWKKADEYAQRLWSLVENKFL